MFCGASWFETLEAAKKLGAFEYDISGVDWHREEPANQPPEPSIEMLAYSEKVTA